jgi:hypothetical protein
MTGSTHAESAFVGRLPATHTPACDLIAPHCGDLIRQQCRAFLPDPICFGHTLPSTQGSE